MTLSNLQSDFLQAIFSPQRDAAASLVRSQGELDAEQRVGIYRNSVHGILHQYLASLYPVCQDLLGEKFFEGFCDVYIDQYPPTTAYLSDYGNELAKLMQTHDAFAELRWIADMAQLEWTRHQAWNAINQDKGDFSQLATIPAEDQANIRFELPASAQLLASDYATHQVWVAHQPEDIPEKIPLEHIQIRQPTYIYVWRAGRTLQQIVLNEQQWTFLTEIQKGLALGELTELFQEQLPNLLTTAIQHDWVISFSTH
jgi:hypothetical protein